MGFRTDNISNNNRPLQDFGGDNYSLYFAGNTGIGNGNYPAFPGIGSVKTGVDSYFQAHKIDLPAEYQSALQALSEIKIGRAFGRPNQVHISVPWNVLSNLGIEYLCFSGKKWDDISSEPERTYYALITDFATVNSNSTRVSFAVDYVASYWDMLDISTDTGFICPIERRSECVSQAKPDFDGIYTSQQTDGLNLPNIEYKYDVLNLPDGDSIPHNFAQAYPGNSTLETITRSLFDPALAVVSLQCMVNVDGNVSGLQMNFQSGSSIGGFLYSFHLEGDQLEHFMNDVIIAYSRTLLTMGQPLLAVLRGAYLLPQFAAFNCTPVKGGYVGSDGADFTEKTVPAGAQGKNWEAFKEMTGNMLISKDPKQALRHKSNFVLHNLASLSNMLGLQGDDALMNNTVMNYITYTLRTSQNSLTVSPFSFNRVRESLPGYGVRPVMEIVFELFGGATGLMKSTVMTRGYDYAVDNPSDYKTQYNVSLSPYNVATPIWPTVNFMGTQTDHVLGNLGTPSKQRREDIATAQNPQSSFTDRMGAAMGLSSPGTAFRAGAD